MKNMNVLIKSIRDAIYKPKKSINATQQQSSSFMSSINATLAQQVEQGFRKAKVLGSNPRGGSDNKLTRESLSVQTQPLAQENVISDKIEGYMSSPYSRRARVEETKNKKRSYIYIVLTIVIIAVLIVFGIPLIIKLAAFLGDIKKTTTPIEQSDTTPPAPPQLISVPEYINHKTFEIKGVTEEGAEIIFSINGVSESQIADASGNFSYTTNLIDGKNEIYAIAKDSSGNESQKTEVFQIVFDNTPPELTFLSPNDGAQFYGSKQRQVVIEGKTEPGISLKINDRIVFIDDTGKFTYSTTLNEGDNNFQAIAEDQAGNKTEDGITVHYWY